MWRDDTSFAQGEWSGSSLTQGWRPSTLGAPASSSSPARAQRAISLIGGMTAAAVLSITPAVSAMTERSVTHSVTADPLLNGPAFVVPSAFADAISEMTNYKALKAGWDGPDSVRPKSSIVEGAIGFLLCLPYDLPAPEASVSADGEVSWFWSDDAVQATVSFTRPGRFTYFAKNNLTGTKVKGSAPLSSGIPQDFLDLMRAA